MKDELFTEGRAPGIQKPKVKPKVKKTEPNIKNEMTTLRESVAVSHENSGTCVFPEAHADSILDFPGAVGISPMQRYIVMGEILGQPRCRQKRRY